MHAHPPHAAPSDRAFRVRLVCLWTLSLALEGCAARNRLQAHGVDAALAVDAHVAPRVASAFVSPLLVEGHEPDTRGLVDVRALELACLADGAALTHPKAVRERFDDIAGRQLVPVGELMFVLLTRNPAYSMADPPPQLCRTIASSTVLRAPLIRAREPAARWLVRRLAANLVDDTALLVRDGAHRQLAYVAPPRVLVDDAGVLVAVALPVAVAGGS